MVSCWRYRRERLQRSSHVSISPRAGLHGSSRPWRTCSVSINAQKRVGGRASAAVAQQLWNHLPAEAKNIYVLATFKKHLKTLLLNDYFG